MCHYENLAANKAQCFLSGVQTYTVTTAYVENTITAIKSATVIMSLYTAAAYSVMRGCFCKDKIHNSIILGC